jgi:hypothetical protein
VSYADIPHTLVRRSKGETGFTGSLVGVHSSTSTRIGVLLHSDDVLKVSTLRIVVREVDTAEINLCVCNDVKSASDTPTGIPDGFESRFIHS